MQIRHSKLIELNAFWHYKRDSRRMPCWSSVRFAELKPWLGHLIIMDILEGGRDFRYRLFGSIICAIIEDDFTELNVSDLPYSLRCTVLAEYIQAYSTQVPVLSQRQRPVHRQVHIEKLTLPFSENEDVPDKFLVGVYDGDPRLPYPGVPRTRS